MGRKRSQSILELVNDIQSDDRDASEAASLELVARGSRDVVDALIILLQSTDGRSRNRAAIVLRDIGDDLAIEPIVNAIGIPENCNNRGTLVYALQTLDCCYLFPLLFDLGIEGNYEVRSMALKILEEQDFEVTPVILAEAKNKLDSYMRRNDLRPEDEYFAKELQTIFVNINNKN